MKPAIIFDLDGTAIDSPRTNTPSESVVEAIQKAKEHFYLSAATGRVWSFAAPILRALKITDPCIISSGTQICDPKDGKILWECTLGPDYAQRAIEILAAYGKRKVFIGDHTLQAYLNDDGVDPVGLVLKEPVGLINCTYLPEADASMLAEQLAEIEDVAITKTLSLREGFRDLHVTNKLATKEHAVVELCKMLKTDRTKSYGVGDGYNDIHLFNAVGSKVAMGNAVQELKEAADMVIDSVNEDGLAKFFHELIDT